MGHATKENYAHITKYVCIEAGIWCANYVNAITADALTQMHPLGISPHGVDYAV